MNDQDDEAVRSQLSEPTVIPTAMPIAKPRQSSRKVPPLPSIERRNWLIHSHYVRKEYAACKRLIKDQLKETKGQCEYAIYVQAMILRSEGEIQNSLELFQACHLLNPKNPDNLKQVARNLILLGRHKNAVECYNQAAEISDRDWDICHSLGVCFQFLKQYDKASACYKEALAKNKHSISFTALSKLYLEKDETEKAMDVLKKGVEFAPENADLLTSLGLLYLKKEDPHKAFEYLGQVLTLDPENYQAILAVSSLMQVHGDFDVALTKYRVAAQAVPESSSVWNNIGMCYYGKKKIVPAISCLKRAHYHSPFDWKILYNLSLLHLTTQQYASSFQFASTAITLKQDHGPLFTLLAIALANLGQEENAERAYQQAVSLSPDDVYTNVNYCSFLLNHSKHKEALQVYSQFRSKYSDAELAQLDKEVVDICKKLSAAMNVGSKVVAEKEKTSKRKKSKTKVLKENSSSSHSDPSTQDLPESTEMPDTDDSRSDAMELSSSLQPSAGLEKPMFTSTLPPLKSRPPKLPPLMASTSRDSTETGLK